MSEHTETPVDSAAEYGHRFAQAGSLEEKGRVALEFLERTSSDDLRKADWWWNFWHECRRARLGSPAYKIFKGLGREFGRSLFEEGFVKQLRLRAAARKRRKSDSYDHLELAVDIYWWALPFCTRLKEMGKYFSKKQQYDRFRGLLMKHRSPAGDWKPPTRDKLLRRRRWRSNRARKPRLSEFVKWLMAMDRDFLDNLINNIYCPGTNGRTRRPSVTAAAVAGQYAHVPINRLQRLISTRQART